MAVTTTAGQDLDRISGSGSSSQAVQGAAAQDAAVTGAPVLMGLRASTATPSAMSADGDAVDAWGTRNGATNTQNIYQSDPVNDGARSYLALVQVRPTITTTATQYSQYDNAGGILSTGAVAYAAGYALQLRSIDLTDNLGQNAAMDIDFYDSSPAGTFTDNAKAVPSAADLGVHLGRVSIATGSWAFFSDPAALKSSVSINFGDEGLPLTPAASTIFFTITLTGAVGPTWAANATTLRGTFTFRKAVNL